MAKVVVDGVEYSNPTPVVACIVPIIEHKKLANEISILGVRRDIEPKKGLVGLPGGYLDSGETWREGMAREVLEETTLIIHPNKIVLFSVDDILHRDQIILFGLAPIVKHSEINWGYKGPEVQELVSIGLDDQLAFSSHTDAAKEFFDKILYECQYAVKERE